MIEFGLGSSQFLKDLQKFLKLRGLCNFQTSMLVYYINRHNYIPSHDKKTAVKFVELTNEKSQLCSHPFS